MTQQTLPIRKVSEPTIYVDTLNVYHNAWGPFLGGSCHMFSRVIDTEALHSFALRLGLKRSWFQKENDGAFHYDLTKAKRALAVKLGAVEVDSRSAVAIWRENRAIMNCIICKSQPDDPGPGCPCSHAPCLHDQLAQRLV